MQRFFLRRLAAAARFCFPQVVLKIIKHCQEALPGFVTGQLLGLDIGRTLEVTNCFPFPSSEGGKGDADDDSAE